MLNEDSNSNNQQSLAKAQTTNHNPLNDHDYCRGKRNKPNKSLDSEFCTYISSDYSNSEVESEQESDYNSEDDPDKLWCLCQKPHEDKFMICCDICKYWYHGHCVGVTKLMGDRFEKQGKEWFCAECHEKLREGIPRHAIPLKITVKEKKVKKRQTSVPGKRGRGRPRKSESATKDVPVRASLRNARKSSSNVDSELDNGKLKKNLNKPDARSESFSEFENHQRLKELIKERKRDFFYKRSLMEQQKAARRNELGLGKQSLTCLSDSLDSLASSTSTPNMSNLPINIKSELKSESKPNIVLQINTKKDSSIDQDRIVTTIVRSPKKVKLEPSNPIVDDLFTADPIQVSKKTKKQVSSPSDTSQSTSNDNITRKNSNSSGSNFRVARSNSTSNDPTDVSTPKKKPKDTESSPANGSNTPVGPKHIAQKIKEILESRSKQIKDLEVKSEDIEKLASEIEIQLNENFKEGTNKYNNKFRSLFFNLKDQKNEELVKNVLIGEIPPSRLVKMSPDEMASHELAKWRERENKHSIELIKRDAQLLAQQVIVKKTHKGEEVLSGPSAAETDDIASNQEPPTTPTKIGNRETHPDNMNKANTSSSVVGTSVKGSGQLKVKISGLNSDSTVQAAASPKRQTNNEESVAFIDTTKDHKNHVYDLNCRICTNRPLDESAGPDPKKEVAKNELVAKIAETEKQPDQPKRFRVSIDTKIDPANLSRLTEPLIKPTEASDAMEVDEYNHYGTPPYDEPNNVEDEEIDLYDPEHIPSKEPMAPRSAEPGTPEPIWSGTINMSDVPKFSATATAVSESAELIKDELSKNLMVCGRIAPDQVHAYIKKLKSSPKNQILLIQINPSTEDDKKNFNMFVDHLYSRHRAGVVQLSSQSLKDFYLLPINETGSIPDVYKPIKGPGLNRKEHPTCLLGVVVRIKRSSPTSSGYVPSSIT